MEAGELIAGKIVVGKCFQIMPFADALRIAHSFGKLAQFLFAGTRQPIRSVRMTKSIVGRIYF
jgi:hypothetical protein